MYKLLFKFILISLFSANVFADNGLITIKSAYDVETTTTRFETVLKAKGMTVFARINHAEAAEKIGKTLRPTELIIFGNPKIGSVLMQCQQSIAIDLPQKALIWQDEQGDVWFSYNNPKYLQTRHQLEGCDEVLVKIENALKNFAQAATK